VRIEPGAQQTSLTIDVTTLDRDGTRPEDRKIVDE